MNRIDKTFTTLKSVNKKSLITFITAGDGGLDYTEQAVYAMAEAGADIIELGVPFSDPVAEGVVIQEASQRALRNGTTIAEIFNTVSKIRESKRLDENFPLLLMLYANSIYRFGAERFFTLCEQCGVDGVIVPDLPFEERLEFAGTAKAHNTYSVSLVAPTSHERIKSIAENAAGFLYCVSTVGVTGVRSEFNTDFGEFFGGIKKYAKIPACVGFGIGTPEQAKRMSGYCDGVIVGSAVVKIAASGGTARDIGDFVKSLRKAIDNA